MNIKLEYDPDDPEDTILAERIIKCNSMTSILWKMVCADEKEFKRDKLLELLKSESINIEKLWQ